MLVAAEMKAFSPLGWKPEWDVKSIMEQGWKYDSRTLFKNVKKLSGNAPSWASEFETAPNVASLTLGVHLFSLFGGPS